MSTSDNFDTWSKFAESGKIDDYLSYRSHKKDTDLSAREEKSDASKHRRPRNKGTEYQ